MSKRRILIIENSVHVTGALKSITRTAYDLRDNFDFVFVLPKNSKGKFWIEEKGFDRIIEIPMRELSKRTLDLLLYIPTLISNYWRLRRIVRREAFDLIHSNDLYNMLPVLLRIFKIGPPYVCHVRFLASSFPGFIFKFWLKMHGRFAARIIAVSQSAASFLGPERKLVVIHNELPVEERHPRIISGRPTQNTLLYLSNFMRGKGQDYAIKAFARVHSQLPGWTLKFVGGDMGLEKNKQYRMELESLALSLGVAQKIRWQSFTKDVEIEYKSADIVLNFSEAESFSITCLEACFFGKPLIATDCGGPVEIIDPDISGLLVPNRDIAAMAAAIFKLAKDEELRIMLGSKAAAHVREKFSIEKTSMRLKEVYDSICS